MKVTRWGGRIAKSIKRYYDRRGIGREVEVGEREMMEMVMGRRRKGLEEEMEAAAMVQITDKSP